MTKGNGPAPGNLVPRAGDGAPAFDYAGLDQAARGLVRRRAGEIHALVRSTAQGVVDIGRKLALSTHPQE